MPDTIGDCRLRPWPRRRAGEWSGPFWCCCIVFSSLMVVLILLAAVAVLAIHFGVHPVPPHLAVRSASLDALRYDRQQGVLRDIQLTINAVVENNNARVDLTFSQLMFNLTFDDTLIVSLVADPFGMPRKTALPLNYTARSSNIVLLDGATEMEDALSRALVPFRLAGRARVHWKVGKVVAFKTWAHLACDMVFYWPPRTTGTTAYPSCSSTNKL